MTTKKWPRIEINITSINDVIFRLFSFSLQLDTSYTLKKISYWPKQLANSIGLCTRVQAGSFTTNFFHFAYDSLEMYMQKSIKSLSRFDVSLPLQSWPDQMWDFYKTLKNLKTCCRCLSDWNISRNMNLLDHIEVIDYRWLLSVTRMTVWVDK